MNSRQLLNTPLPPSKSDVTEVTDFTGVTNQAFIDAIFQNPIDSKPIVISFEGSPAEQGDWSGRAFVGGRNSLPDTHNNYLSMCSYRPNDKGQYARTKAQCEAVHWFLLDDVGINQKVDPDRITLEPSWKIETSKGNFQLGYIMKEPLKDRKLAEAILDAIIDAGLSDKGANGALSRVGRMPVAVNGKSGFACKLVDWHPDRRYTVDELVNGLQIDLQKKSKTSTKAKASHDEVHLARADQNPVINSLIKRDLYKQPLGDGKHDILCPWANEHTTGDGGTAYFEPSGTYQLGGFKCLHGHCADRHISALYSELGLTREEAKHLSIIKTSAGEIHRIVDAAEVELSLTGRHYQRGGIIVTVSTDPQSKATNVKSLSQPSLMRILSSLASWQRFDQRQQGWVTCDPPEKHVRILYDASAYPHLPILNGIARHPYLRKDGSLVSTAGYDTETGMFGVFDSREFNVPEEPTREDAVKALNLLSELLTEFSFKSEYDKSAAISAIITATVRQSIGLAPMFHVSAPQIASGKSYFCELLSAFATPEKSTPHSFPSDDDEMRKLLLAELLTAPAVVEFDNLTSDLLPHKSLCTALTSQNISGRILGQSKTAEVGTRALFLSSGNNVEPIRDMTRRVLVIRLDPKCETPATRVYKKYPVNEVFNNRGKYISAVLIICRAWIAAEKPMTNVKPLNSYSDWSDLCRQPLLWLGQEDPAYNVFESMAHDPDREGLGALLSAWYLKFDTNSIGVKTLIDKADGDLFEIITDIANEKDGLTVNKKILGRWLKRYTGRMVGNLRLVVDTSKKFNALQYKIEVSELPEFMAGRQ